RPPGGGSRGQAARAGGVVRDDLVDPAELVADLIGPEPAGLAACAQQTPDRARIRATQRVHGGDGDQRVADGTRAVDEDPLHAYAAAGSIAERIACRRSGYEYPLVTQRAGPPAATRARAASSEKYRRSFAASSSKSAKNSASCPSRNTSWCSGVRSASMNPPHAGISIDRCVIVSRATVDSSPSAM